MICESMRDGYRVQGLCAYSTEEKAFIVVCIFWHNYVMLINFISPGKVQYSKGDEGQYTNMLYV